MFRSGLKILNSSISHRCVKRFSSSALYVTGEKGMEVYAAIVPYLDCDQRFKDLRKLEENIQKRELDINISDLKELWEFYKKWTESKEAVEKKRLEVALEMKKVYELESSKTNEKEIYKIKLQGKLLKEKLKEINKTVWGVEEVVVLRALGLPNDLHPDVPNNELVLKNFTPEMNHQTKENDHLVIGNELNCVHYHNAVTCYFRNDAAQFELAVGSFFKDRFLAETFIPFCNADFAKSVLVEGVSLSPVNPHKALLLKDVEQGLMHKLHLAGGSSLFSFCAFHAKQTVTYDPLPARYITVGRQYNPKPINSLGGLYSLWQSTVAQLFIVIDSDDSKMNSEFNKTLELLYEIYKTLGMNFRIVNQPANLLQPWESLRSSLQVYSYSNDTFVEVGHLSIIDDFISKRLRMCYLDEKKEKFLKLISGTVVNIPVLLALCLERSNDSLFFPEVVTKFKIF